MPSIQTPKQTLELIEAYGAAQYPQERKRYKEELIALLSPGEEVEKLEAEARQRLLAACRCVKQNSNKRDCVKPEDASLATRASPTMDEAVVIERVALAIERADNEKVPDGYAESFGCDHDDISDWGYYLAKAAIAAMKQPTTEKRDE